MRTASCSPDTTSRRARSTPTECQAAIGRGVGRATRIEAVLTPLPAVPGGRLPPIAVAAADVITVDRCACVHPATRTSRRLAAPRGAGGRPHRCGLLDRPRTSWSAASLPDASVPTTTSAPAALDRAARRRPSTGAWAVALRQSGKAQRPPRTGWPSPILSGRPGRFTVLHRLPWPISAVIRAGVGVQLARDRLKPHWMPDCSRRVSATAATDELAAPGPRPMGAIPGIAQILRNMDGNLADLQALYAISGLPGANDE